jgi:NAD(P)-dependent dehydrogenase (short-subunit alcohol dehydrogenase family)
MAAITVVGGGIAASDEQRERRYEGSPMSTRTPGGDSMTVLVTGATAGIGFATAAGLARLGQGSSLTGRAEERGRAVAEELRVRSRTGDVQRPAGPGQAGRRLVNGDLGSDVGDASPRRVRIEAALVLTSAHGASPAGV